MGGSFSGVAHPNQGPSGSNSNQQIMFQALQEGKDWGQWQIFVGYITEYQKAGGRMRNPSSRSVRKPSSFPGAARTRMLPECLDSGQKPLWTFQILHIAGDWSCASLRCLIFKHWASCLPSSPDPHNLYPLFCSIRALRRVPPGCNANRKSNIRQWCCWGGTQPSQHRLDTTPNLRYDNVWSGSLG